MTAIYPNNVAGDADLPAGVNNLATTLNGNLAASGDNTSGSGIALATTVNFPTAGVVTIENEVVHYTGISGNNLTGYTRGFDGTTATSHATGVAVSVEVVANHVNAMRDEIKAMEDDIVNGIRQNAFYNILVNPGFEVWQRGVSFLSVPNGSFTSDKWYMNYTGSPIFTVAQNTLSPTLKQGRYSLSSQITGTGGSTTYSIRQSIENYRDYIGKTISFSIWVNSSIPGIQAFITNGTPSTSFSVAHSGGSTFQRLICTYTVPAGSTSLQVGVGFVTVSPNLSTFYMDAATLFLGTKSVDYQPFQTADDFTRCQRYFERGDGVAYLLPMNRDGSHNYAASGSDFKAVKSSAPTMTFTVNQALMLQICTVGTGVSASDTSNWSASNNAGATLNSYGWLAQRSAANASYDLVSIKISWIAETT